MRTHIYVMISISVIEMPYQSNNSEKTDSMTQNVRGHKMCEKRSKYGSMLSPIELLEIPTLSADQNSTYCNVLFKTPMSNKSQQRTSLMLLVTLTFKQVGSTV